MAVEAPVLANETERPLAEQSSRTLAPLASKPLRVRIEGTNKTVTLPASAVRMLVDLLNRMARGEGVAVVPYHQEISTQRAADLLGVSRPHLVRMLEQGELPARKVGTHRRVPLAAVLAYKRDLYDRRRRSLEELTALDQELGLY